MKTLNIKTNFQKYRLDIIYLMILIVLPFLFYGDALIGGYALDRGDTWGWISSYDLLKESLLSGSIPSWDIFETAGSVYNLSGTLCYPFFWITFPFSVVTQSVLYITVHMAIAGVGLYLYLKELGLSPHVCFFGGIVFAFSYTMLVRTAHFGVLSTIAWTPVVLLAAEKMVRNKGKIKYALLAGIAAAMQIMTGFPQAFLYSCIFILVYYIARSIHARMSIGRLILSLAITLAVTIGLWAISLLPTLELMQDTGRAQVSYDYFAAGAHELTSLLALVSPSAWTMTGTVMSQGLFMVDAYFGVIVLALFIYGAIYCWKQFHVKLLVVLAALAFLFVIAPTIPSLGHILYKIPLVGSFRYSSRAIFLMQICMIIIAATGMQDIIGNKKYSRYLKYSLIFAAAITTLMIVMHVNRVFFFTASDAVYMQNQQAYWSVVAIVWVNALIALTVFLFYVKEKRKFLAAICATLLTILSFCDLVFLNVHPAYSEMAAARYDTSVLEETEFSTFMNTQAGKEYRVAKIGDTITESSINMMTKMSVLNRYLETAGYTAYENSNYLKLLDARGDYLAGTNPTPYNLSIYSMLAVKYFAVQDGYDFQPYQIQVEKVESSETIYKLQESVALEPSADISVPVIEPIQLESDQFYLIEVEMTQEQSASYAVVDVYGTDFGDGFALMKDAGSHKQYGLISTNGVDVPEDTVVRLILQSSGQGTLEALKIKNVTDCVEKVDLPVAASVTDYKLVSVKDGAKQEIGDTVIYENPNAKALLYSAERIVSANSNEEIVYNAELLDFDDYIYVVGHGEMDLAGSNTVIDIQEVSDNFVRGKVSASGDTFVVMAQNFHKNWKAYVDGAETKIFQANGSLQGIDVPAGEHIIEFDYTPQKVYLGAGISLVTLGSIVAALFALKRREKRKNR